MKKNPYSTAYGMVRALRTRPFLRGPIGWEALRLATRVGGKALAVYLFCQHKAALCKSRSFTLGKNEVVEHFGSLTPLSAHRNLVKLDNAGLIQIQRFAGKKLRVSLTDLDLDVAPTCPPKEAAPVNVVVPDHVSPTSNDMPDRAQLIRSITEFMENGYKENTLPGPGEESVRRVLHGLGCASAEPDTKQLNNGEQAVH